jgi:hypothetical protein
VKTNEFIMGSLIQRADIAPNDVFGGAALLVPRCVHVQFVDDIHESFDLECSS